MIHISTDVLINRPVNEVFAFVADNWFSNLRVWNPDLVESKQTSEFLFGKGNYWP